MSEQLIRIDSKTGRTRGWQARVAIPHQPKRYVSRFFADKRHGGQAVAYALAEAALPALKRNARAKARAAA